MKRHLSLPGKGEETPLLRGIYALFLDREQNRALRTVLMPKWHILGWPALVSFNFSFQKLKDFSKDISLWGEQGCWQALLKCLSGAFSVNHLLILVILLLLLTLGIGMKYKRIEWEKNIQILKCVCFKCKSLTHWNVHLLISCFATLNFFNQGSHLGVKISTNGKN